MVAALQGIAKVTAGLAESNGSLPPGLWRDSFHATRGLTACTPGSALGPTLGNEYGRTLPVNVIVRAFVLRLKMSRVQFEAVLPSGSSLGQVVYTHVVRCSSSKASGLRLTGCEFDPPFAPLLCSIGQLSLASFRGPLNRVG